MSEQEPKRSIGITIDAQRQVEGRPLLACPARMQGCASILRSDGP